MEEKIVLLGAGATGSYALRHLRAQDIEPVAFADNSESKWGEVLEGIGIMNPNYIHGLYPDATWVACAISRPAATEIREQLKQMGVKVKPLWECLPVCHGIPSYKTRKDLAAITYDAESTLLVNDQCIFRRNPDYDQQVSPSPISELYFPDFITHREDEVFIDCGAADGDTVRDFLKRWPKFNSIVAFEPDRKNYNKLIKGGDPEGKGRITSLGMAVGDHDGYVEFTANGDYSSHLSGVESRDATSGEATKVHVTTLDKMLGNIVPTYIKADVEGSELELLWGARRILKEFMPVLAICAYHTSDHLWQIPMLIHAIQPEYKLYFRRYAEGAFEIVWYAVPPERIRMFSEESYSDNHVG